MAKSELKDLYAKIAESNARCKYYFQFINFPAIIEQFQDIEEQDRPDGIILLDNTVYMIEHFQISPYLTKRSDDKLQIVLNSNNTKKLGNEVRLVSNDNDWENCLLHNWLTAFSYSLSHHVDKYQDYTKNTQELHPGKPYKFIIVVEDNSNSIVTNENLCILDIQEFVERVLSCPQIDGVITFKTSPLENLVVAKDRTQLEADQRSGKLLGMAYCDFLMLLEKVGGIQGLTVKQRMTMKDQIFRLLGNLKEIATIEDSVQVEKHGNSFKGP